MEAFCQAPGMPGSRLVRHGTWATPKATAETLECSSGLPHTRSSRPVNTAALASPANATTVACAGVKARTKDAVHTNTATQATRHSTLPCRSPLAAVGTVITMEAMPSGMMKAFS